MVEHMEDEQGNEGIISQAAMVFQPKVLNSYFLWLVDKFFLPSLKGMLFLYLLKSKLISI
jgi:hypothetical protein